MSLSVIQSEGMGLSPWHRGQLCSLKAYALKCALGPAPRWRSGRAAEAVTVTWWERMLYLLAGAQLPRAWVADHRAAGWRHSPQGCRPSPTGGPIGSFLQAATCLEAGWGLETPDGRIQCPSWGVRHKSFNEIASQEPPEVVCRALSYPLLPQ